MKTKHTYTRSRFERPFLARLNYSCCRFTGGMIVALFIGILAGCESSDNELETAGETYNFSEVSWIGPNFSGATRDDRAVLHWVTVDPKANMLYLSYDPLPRDWPRQVNAPGMLCMFVQREDGSWRGGKFEWLDPGQTAKTLKNIDNGYNGWRRPPAGARVAVVIFSVDGRVRSNPAYSHY